MMESSSSATTVAARRPRPHVVLVSSPGAGHLIPMSELARRLVAHHGLAATLVTFPDPSSSSSAAALLASLAGSGVATGTLPPVPLDDLPAAARPETKVLALVARSVPHLRALLQDAVSASTSGGATRLAALVPDLFCAATLPLAAELGVPGTSPRGSGTVTQLSSPAASSAVCSTDSASELPNETYTTDPHARGWVVRMPSLDVDGGQSSSTGKKKNDPLTWLPEGFLERTKGRGLAVPTWAPQVRVLVHPATAAFVSHCGWNSTLESVAAGVPIVAWPLYAEQRMNAVFLTEHAGLALRPRAREEDGVVPREEVAAAVRELMEGAEKGRAVRRQAGHMQQAAARAWGPEGSSRRALEEVVGKLKAVGGHVASQATRDGPCV
ncbi:hypothetical protein QOZ80_2AG0107550 [Eleusine coracana subsp. coracana]|nr:hypothetical protein QOZ80_2AG0107550 [Eleusine coracana subsp. coracana]